VDGAATVFGPQKGAGPKDVARLEALLAADLELGPFATMPGAGAAGGLGAAFAALGAKLRSGAELVLESLRFGERIADAALVVTGEGQVDLTTFAGKAPGSVLSKAEESGVPALLFGGRVASDMFAMTTLVALSGDPRRAGRDLRDLGRSLSARLAA
jgi:glycerate kinase